VALGQGVDDLVDADVAQYIHRNKLYKDDITVREKTF
jgi:nicotinic acid mononucleotide adenylyltransferase